MTYRPTISSFHNPIVNRFGIYQCPCAECKDTNRLTQREARLSRIQREPYREPRIPGDELLLR